MSVGQVKKPKTLQLNPFNICKCSLPEFNKPYFLGLINAFVKLVTVERLQAMSGKEDGERYATKVPGWNQTLWPAGCLEKQ